MLRNLFLAVLLTQTLLLTSTAAAPTKLQALRARVGELMHKLPQQAMQLGAAAIIACSGMAIAGCGEERLDDSGEQELVRVQQQVGQMLLIGFRGASIDAETRALFSDVQPGGVILFDADVPDRAGDASNIESPAQLRALTAAIRAIVGDDVLIAVDAEGGHIHRFKAEYGFTVDVPAAAELGTGTAAETFAIAAQLAQQMRAVGVNLNLAPVVDVNVNPESPAIGKLARAFSADPDIVAEHALAFVAGHRQHGVLTTLKHFPGHGSATADTHFGVTDVTDTYQLQELLPYRKIIQEGYRGLIMTAHIVHRNYDSRPATLSPAIITQLLRHGLGFDGVVLSDNMQMEAIVAQYGMGEASVAAVLAGVDIILIANKQGDGSGIQDVYQIRDALVQAVQDGIIPAATIDASLARISALKAEF